MYGVLLSRLPVDNVFQPDPIKQAQEVFFLEK